MRIGVIGVGALGGRHAKAARDLGVLHAVYDVDGAKCERVAREHGVKASPSRDDLLAECDAVVVASPTTTHRDVALSALEAGRHVLVEKPIAEDTGGAREMVEAAKRRGAFLAVGHVERFNPACVAVYHVALSPAFIEGHRLARFTARGADVAVILDLMIHDIDLSVRFVGRPVKSVDAAGVAVVTDSEDIAHCRLRFEGGAVANLTASRVSMKPMRRLRLFQRDLYVAIDMAERSAQVARLVPDAEAKGFRFPLEGTGKSVVLETPDVPQSDAITVQMSAFLRAADGVRTQIATGEEGLRALEVALEVQKQARAALAGYTADARP